MSARTTLRVPLHLCWLGLFLSAGLAADAEKAFDHFYNLEYDEALTELRGLALANPKSPRFYNDLAQTLLYREIFHSGAMKTELATGDTPLIRRPNIKPAPEILDEIDATLRHAFEAGSQRVEEEPKSPQALYDLGVSYASRANVHFFVRKAWYDGLRDVAKSRQLHEKVLLLDPGYTDAALTRGAHDYLISQLSLPYKMVGAILGFRGSRRRGMETIAMVAREGDRRRVTAQLLMVIVYRREGQPESAVPLLLGLAQEFPRNYLFPLELAEMYADSGDIPMAMEKLDVVRKRVKAKEPGFTRITVLQVEALRGHIQFRHGLLSEATATLRAVVAEEAGAKRETRAPAWLKLGQIHDHLGERDAALSAYNSSIAAQPVSDAARQSRLFLLSPYREKKIAESPPTETETAGEP